MNRLQILLSNRHTTGAGTVFLIAKAAQIAALWMPQHKEQFDQTANIIEAAAVAYGFYMAGDAKATTPRKNDLDLDETQQTKRIKQDDNETKTG